jgi:hypothetical protein
MSSPSYRVRRATLDDLKQLTVMWASMNYAVTELAPRVTEFQVAESAQGALLGAIGLQVTEGQGCVHSEVFADFALADALRPLFWERLQALALNQSLFRLWTREPAPFWSHCGLVRADAEALGQLPAAWRAGSATGWLTVKLRENLGEILSADKQFALFMAAERQRTARTLQRGKLLHALAMLFVLLVVCLALGAAFYLLVRNQRPLGR